MRAYGLPRESSYTYHDNADANTYGLKSRFSGTAKRSCFDAGLRTSAKQATRRRWARVERRNGAASILEGLDATSRD